MRSQSKILCLLQCFRLEECEARLPDRGDVGEVWKAGGLHRYMEDDRVLCKLVEVRYRLNEDRGCGGYAGDSARADGLEDGEERISILAD